MNWNKKMSNAKCAVLFMTHTWNVEVESHFRNLRDTLSISDYDVIVLLQKNSRWQRINLPEDTPYYIFTKHSISKLGYTPIRKTIVPGSNHFPLFQFYKDYPHYEYYWIVEYDVCFNGNWNTLFGAYKNSNVDFLSSHITHYDGGDKAWYWWLSLEKAKNHVPLTQRLSSFNPIYRLSHRAMQFLNEKMREGHKGHHEVLIPTLLHTNGYTLEDFGANANYGNKQHEPFYIGEGKVSSMRYRPLIKDEEIIQPDCLYHPCKQAITHAILIQAHKNYEHLVSLINYFNQRCEVFIHIDRKCKFTKQQLQTLRDIPHVKDVYRKYAVHWGGFSILKSSIFLLRQAIKHSNASYVHLLSGQDYPIKPLSSFLRFFDENLGKNYIEFVHLPAPHWENHTYDRFVHFFLYDWLDRTPQTSEFIKKSIQWQKKIGIKRNIPNYFDHLYGGSAWFSITRDATRQVIKYTRRHPRFYWRMNHTFAPDESYINTVIANLIPKEHLCNNNYRYIRWKYEHNNYPANLGAEHFVSLTLSHAFIARKFELPYMTPLIENIDRYLLREEPVNISPTGAWQNPTLLYYKHDTSIPYIITEFCAMQNIDSVLDIGCGTGNYVAEIRKKGIAITGFDANPHTPELSALFLSKDDTPCEVADLTDDWSDEEPFPMVMCIDVCGYIPKTYHEQVLNNLSHLVGRYLFINWQDLQDDTMINIPKQDHPYSEEETIAMFHKHGFEYRLMETFYVRTRLFTQRLKTTLLVFEKTQLTHNKEL